VLNPVNWYKGGKGLYNIARKQGIRAAGSALWQGTKQGYTAWATTSNPREFGQSFGTVLTTVAAVAAPYAKAGSLAKVGSTAKIVGPTRRPVLGKITGYTKHGINRAISRQGHGVSPRAILDAVRNPVKIVPQADGSIQYIGKSAKVVLNKKGEVITVIAKSSKAYRIKR